jgi:vesicle coat complex subunit
MKVKNSSISLVKYFGNIIKSKNSQDKTHQVNTNGVKNDRWENYQPSWMYRNE